MQAVCIGATLAVNHARAEPANIEDSIAIKMLPPFGASGR